MSYDTKNLIRDQGNLPAPQYYNSTADAYEPLQGANGAGRVLLYDAAGNPLFTDSNPASVKLSGRDVEEVVVWNALAITGTSAQISTAIDLSKYRELFIYAYDSHNQNITLSPQVEGGNVFVWDGTTWSSSEDDVVLVADAFRYVLTSRWNWIKGAKSIRFVAVAAAAPTSGSLTLKIWGVPN